MPKKIESCPGGDDSGENEDKKPTQKIFKKPTRLKARDPKIVGSTVGAYIFSRDGSSLSTKNLRDGIQRIETSQNKAGPEERLRTEQQEQIQRCLTVKGLDDFSIPSELIEPIDREGETPFSDQGARITRESVTAPSLDLIDDFDPLNDYSWGKPPKKTQEPLMGRKSAPTEAKKKDTEVDPLVELFGERILSGLTSNQGSSDDELDALDDFFDNDPFFNGE